MIGASTSADQGCGRAANQPVGSIVGAVSDAEAAAPVSRDSACAPSAEEPVSAQCGARVGTCWT